MSSEPDRGDADPELMAALASRDASAIRTALDAARLLVAVIALPGTEHASEGEMALALLESGDGAQALPAFTSLAALTGWRAEARPVPRPAAEVLAYATAEGIPVVLDPGSDHAWTFERDPSPEVLRPAYAAPTWKPGRRLRKAAQHAVHRVYAVDAVPSAAGPAGAALAVVCPEGTLDPTWAEELLAKAPVDTRLILVPAAGESDLPPAGAVQLG